VNSENLYGLYETIEKMISDRMIRFQLVQQLNRFNKAQMIVWKKHDNGYQG